MKPKTFVAAWLAGLLLVSVAGYATPKQPRASPAQVLFVCEHGNVKSLMAASYFNQLAQERGLPFHAVSRGSAPDSNTVPPKIIAGLGDDGFDVHDFHPVKVSGADVAVSKRVVTIGVKLPGETTGNTVVEQWDDVPPASVDYAAARDSLQRHVRELADQLAAAR
jgi:protein-tyrosine-phosphatase